MTHLGVKAAIYECHSVLCTVTSSWCVSFHQIFAASPWGIRLLSPCYPREVTGPAVTKGRGRIRTQAVQGKYCMQDQGTVLLNLPQGLRLLQG